VARRYASISWLRFSLAPWHRGDGSGPKTSKQLG